MKILLPVTPADDLPCLAFDIHKFGKHGRNGVSCRDDYHILDTSFRKGCLDIGIHGIQNKDPFCLSVIDTIDHLLFGEQGINKVGNGPDPTAGQYQIDYRLNAESRS